MLRGRVALWRNPFSQVAGANPVADQVGGPLRTPPNAGRVSTRQTETFLSRDALWRDCKRHFQLFRGK